MKKYIIALTLIISLSISSAVLASDISNSIYFGQVRVTNNSTATGNVSGVFANNSTAWISAVFMNATATDIAIRGSSGVDKVFMPGYDDAVWSVFVDDAPAGNKDLTLFTNATGGKVRYFPDTAGMAVEDDDTIELSDNFSVSLSGRFDATATGNLTDKPSVFNFKGTAGNVSADIPGVTPVVETTTGGFSASCDPCTVNMPAGVASGDFLVVMFGMQSGKTSTFPAGWSQSAHYGANPRMIIAYKVSDGTEGASESVDITAATMMGYQSYRITGSSNAIEFGTVATGDSANPDPPSLSPTWGSGKTLWFATATTFSSISAYPANFTGGRDDGNGAGFVWQGTAQRANETATENPGTITSSASNNWAAQTVAIEAGGSAVSATVGSGEHTLTVTGNVSSLGLYVDSVLKDSSALGAGVVNNSENLTLVENGVMSYLQTAEITIDGVLAGSWSWEYAETFTDGSANSNTATPSFRTASSDADVSIALIGFSPLEKAEVDADTAITWPGFGVAQGAPDAPGTAYSENTTPGIFFAPLIHSIWRGTGAESFIPVAVFWYCFAFFGIIFWGMVAYWAFAERGQQALLIKIIVMLAIMTFWALPGPNIYGLYVVVYFVLWSFGVLVMSKSFGW